MHTTSSPLPRSSVASMMALVLRFMTPARMPEGIGWLDLRDLVCSPDEFTQPSDGEWLALLTDMDAQALVELDETFVGEGEPKDWFVLPTE